MRKRYLFILFLFILLAGNIFAVQKPVLFWSSGCPHCQKVVNYLEQKNIKDNFILEEVHSQKGNKDFLESLKECKIPVSQAGVPLLKIKNNCILGYRDIINFLKTKDRNFFVSFNQTGETSLTWPMVISGALADSINPCAFAVLIILLTTVLISRERKKILSSAFGFILAIFLAYLAMGLGGWKIFSSSGINLYIVKGAGFLAIILGFLNLKDFFRYGEFGFVMEVPFSWRPLLKKTISFLGLQKSQEVCEACKDKCIKESVRKLGQRNFSGYLKWFNFLPLFLASLLVGLAISFFLLPCTSGPYIVILGLLAKTKRFYKALNYLIIYNLVFILPMILITLAVYFGLDPKKLEKIREKNIKLIHLFIALLLFAIGGYVLIVF